MSYRHRMMSDTQGIRPTCPVRWRGLEGMVGVFWQAEAQKGARGYYLSPDPRIVVFLNDVSPHVLMSNRVDGIDAHGRPLLRASYVPAGMPMWTRFTGPHRFAHLDLHLHRDRLLRLLCPALGRSEALSVLRRPVEIQDSQALTSLTGLLVDELAGPAPRHPVFAESLAAGIVTGLLDMPAPGSGGQAKGGLTPLQMRRLKARLLAGQDRRLSVAEMAATVGLSESWFAAVFKQTTSQTPLQWQRSQRIAQAQRLLADPALSVAEVAARLGFSDQAHLTRSFRQVAGETPAAWRRMQRPG